MELNLELTKPLAFFDLETTGVDVATAKICSISIRKIMPDKKVVNVSHLINPGIEMTAENIAIHGITNEMVKGEPKFHQYSVNLYSFLKDCDLAGYNSNSYDIPLLCEEFMRCNIKFPLGGTKFIDVCNIFKIQEPRTLEAAHKFYTGTDMEGAHDATNDVNATFNVFCAQLDRYENVKAMDFDTLSKFSCYDKTIVDFAGTIGIDDDGDYIYNIGKNKGTKIKRDTGFANWMLNQGFTLNTKNCIREILDSFRVKKPNEFL